MTGVRRRSPASRVYQAILILGVVLIAGALHGLFVEVHATVGAIHGHLIGPIQHRSGLAEVIPRDQWSSYIARVLDGHEELMLRSFRLGMFGVLLSGWAARRLGRASGIPLGWIVAPVLLPVGLGLLAGLLATWTFDGLLESAFEALTDEALRGTGGCMPSLTLCSHVRAFELVSRVAVAIICVLTAAAFMLAARRAWALGERGVTLSKGWSIVAIALFGLGALGLISTAPHAVDHASEASVCQDERDASIDNATSLELQGVRVESCGANPWLDYANEHGVEGRALEVQVVGQIQAFADGWVSELPDHGPVELFTPELLAERARSEIEWAKEVAEARDDVQPSDFVLTLYIDERTPATAIGEHLRAARAAGVTSTILFGRSEVERSLESAGTWTRRSLCPIATIVFDDAGRELSDHATWAEILAQGQALDPEPLRLRP